MAKSKYESHVLPRLEEIKDWARNGATDEQIYKKLRISKQAFYDYQKRYPDFLDILKYSKDYCDAQVENALYQKAIKGDTLAQIFWLKNRRPNKWREKVESVQEDTKSKLDELIVAINNAKDEHAK